MYSRLISKVERRVEKEGHVSCVTMLCLDLRICDPDGSI